MRRSNARALVMVGCASLYVGCGGSPDQDPSGGDDPPASVPTRTTDQASFVLIGNIFQNGTLVSFDDVTGVTGIDLTKIVGLTACDARALYAVERDVGPAPLFSITYSIWFSNSSGQSWTMQTTPGKGPEIACDHAQLATLDDAHRLWAAPTGLDGSLGSWALQDATTQVDRIQGGDGTIYGVKVVASGKDVYIASGKAINGALTWSGPIANIGATQVTGVGATRTGTDDRSVPNSLAWPRAAFDLEVDGTVSTNATLLDGQNLWFGMNTGTERYTTLSAASPNVLFAIQNRSGVNHINRIRIDETDCSDGVDNDHNGLTDAEDPACVQPVSATFCAGHADGNYCGDRFQPASFLGQTNQNTSLVHCAGHVATVTPGVCVHGAAGNNDTLATLDALTPADPPNTGHYCNVIYPDSTWGFGWTGATPCATLLAAKSGGKIVRAGLYSTTGSNDILAQCNNGSFLWGATGAAALQHVSDSIGHTANACILVVSPGDLPLFQPMFHDELPLPRVALWFDHAPGPAVSLAQFGHGETGTSVGIDRDGFNKGDRESAYDAPLDESVPLYAPSGGTVIANGSRERDITGNGSGRGSQNQGELYVRYSIGSDPTYRETFVVYYAHVRKRLVVNGQTVKAGQILGYVGATGATGGFAHLHVGVFRLTNTNAHTTAQPELGYHVSFAANSDASGNSTGSWNAVDPLGWNNTSAFDPSAYQLWASDSGRGFLGYGAWSPNLFTPGSAFRYP